MKRRMLIVEDEYYQADDCAQAAERAGFDVVGPFSDVSDAMDGHRDNPIDCALIDVNLRGSMIYPLLDKLMARKTPVTLYTGYDHLPAPYDTCTIVVKPRDCAEAVRTLV